MKIWLLTSLTFVNIIIAIATYLQHAAPAQAAGIAPVLRGSSLEIVDS